MAYNSKSFRKTNGLTLSAPKSTENPQEKSQYDSSAFRSALGDLDQLKAFNERSKVMNDYRSRNKVAYDNYQREVRSPAYQVQQLNQYVTEQYGYDPGITAKDVDDYISTFNSYLDGTNMSDSAVSFRQSMNSDNQQKTDKYNAALNERDNIQRQMNVFEQGGRAWDDSEYNRLQGLLGGINQDISDMEESGYRNSAYEAARYRRSGQDTKDKYADIRRRTGFSDARSRVTGGENYSLEDDDLGRYFENKDYVTPLPDIDTGDYNYSQYDNPDKANGDRRHWDLLTDDEINTYYSILETDGKSKATQYLDDMQITLDRRNTEANSFTKEEIENLSAVDRAGVSVATVLANVAGAVPAFMDDAVNTLLGKEINPYSNAHLAQNFASDTRSSTAEYIDEKTGAKDTDFMTWGNVYQAIMSAGDSMVGTLIGPTAYGITMGMGAASSRAKELYDSGATTDQIVKSSLASGAAEMLFEKLSMSLLLDKVVKYGAGGFKDFAKGILVQGLGEGSEEFFTDIANTITDALFAYDFSNWKADKEAYLSEHPDATDEEVLSYAIFSTGRKALQAAAAGAISGSAMGAGGTAVGYVTNKQEGQRLLNGSQSQLENIIYGADDVMNSYKNAKLTDRGFVTGKLEQLAVGKDVADIKSKYDSGNLTSKDAAKLGKVSSVMQQEIISQDVDKIASAAESKLREIGVTDTYDGGEEVSTLAKAIAKTVAGEDLKSWEKSAIRNSEQAKQILQEIAGASDVVQKYAESGAAYQVAEQNAELAGEQLEQAQNDVSMQTDFQTAAENFQKADEKRTAAKEAFDAAQNEYENGSTAWARQIGARVVGEGVLSENSVEGYSHLFGKHAKLFTEAHEDGQDARQYTIEFAKAYNEGTKGGNLQALIDSGSLQNLSTVQINAAYQAGLDARNSLNTRRDTDGLHLRQSSIWENGANSTADVQEVEANAEQDQKRNADSGRKTAAEKAAGFTAEKAYRRVTTLEELGVKDAKAGIKVTQVSSDYSDETARAYEMCVQNGVKCVFFTGGYLQTKDGIIARGANKGGVVYIRADDPNFTATEIAGHEIGHELVRRGSLDMDAVASEVRKEYTKEELSKIVDDYGLDFLADGVSEDELTDLIIEEITCDALGGMNAFASNREGNAEFVQKLQGLAEKHYTGKTGEGTDTQKRSTNAATDSSQKLSTVTEAQDSEYMELAKDPEKNREKLESMVWDAAEKAGYKGMYYHGSKKGGGFTKFRDWQYFTQNRDYAKRYSERGNDASLYSVFVKMDNLFDTRNAEERAKFADARLEYGLGELQENGLPDWTDGYDLVDYIEENGLPYDSIVLDEGGDLVNGKPVSRGLSYVVRKSSQIKSAEPVTYDDNRNVIPLSKRFDDSNDDIRYSMVPTAPADIHRAVNDVSYRDDVLLTDGSPKIMLDQKGVRNLPMVMKPSHIRDNVLTEKEAEERGLPVGGKHHYHGLGEAGFQDIIMNLDNVTLAYRGTKNSSRPERRENYFLLVASMPGENGSQINVPVYIDEHAQRNRVFFDTNRMATAFGRDEFSEYIRKEIASGNLVRIKKNKAPEPVNGRGNPGGYSSSASGDIITQPTQEVKQNFSTVNSTQLALENPDVYEEIQVTFDEILQKTKGKDLEAALLEEAQKHQEDLQMWEHEAAVLTKLWKQSEKNEAKLAKVLSERRDRIAEVSEELRERRRDVRTMENEFVRVVREWEKQTGKLEGKTKEAASLKQALKDSIREHRQDNAAWEREYDRLLKMYERNDRQIDRLAADIAHRKEMAAKSVEGRKRTVIRNKILDLNKDFQRILDHPEKGITAHAPRSLIKPLAEFCSMFANAEWGYRGEQLEKAIANGNSQVRIDQISRAQALMAQISKRYEDLASAAGVQGASYQQGTADQIKQATEIMADMFNYKSIHDMTSDDLSVIYKAMKSIMHSIKTANKLTAMETTKTLVETVNHLNRNLDEAIPMSRWPKRFVQRYLMWQMRPNEFFQYICGYAKGNVGLDIDRMFIRGTEKMLGVQRDFDNLFNPILNQDYKEIRRMTSTKEKDLVTVGLKDLNGNDVKITRGMRLSVYMMLNQEDSLRSLAYGGFKLPRIDEYYHGNISAAYGGGDEHSFYTTAQGETISEAAHNLQELKKELKATDDEAERNSLQQSIDAAEERLNALVAGEEARLNMMREAIWADMTDYEKQLVEAANQWMEHSGNLMQETYYELNGFDPARVNNYWPIHRDPTTIQSLDTTAVVNEFNLANSGFTKERVRASNPILLTDFFQELLSSKNKMSRYYGFAVAQRDFNKLYMFKSPGAQSSVKQRIMAKFQSGTYKIGVSAEQYIDNYLKSVSGANKGDNSWLSGLYSMAAGATLSANPRVAISQLASIPTAAAEVGWKNAAKGFAKGIGYAFSKQAKDQLSNDSVWFYQRYKGEGSTREIADMRNSGSMVSKAMNSKWGKMMFNWCQNMDVLATGPIMWEMAKSAVLETGMKESDAGFKEAVQDKYANIIRFTQPNYTETERSDLLRDKSVGSKILTMYKTQSNQNFNILIGASMEMRKMKADFNAGKNGVTEADVKAATAKCVNAYTAVVIGGTVAFSILRLAANFLMRAVNPYRDDDTDEVTDEGIFKGFMKDVFSSLAGTVAMGSILYDGVYAIMSGERYYGVSDNAVGMLSDTLTSLVNLGQAVKNGKEVKGKAVKALMNVATAFGIPANNLKKLGTAAYGWVNQAFFDGPGVRDADNPTSTQDRARYVNAVLADDQEKADNVMAHLISQSDAANEYLQTKEATSGVRSYLKKQFEDQKISEDNVTKVLQQLEYEDDEIKKDIKQWTCFIDTGIKYSDIKEAVMKRVISEDYAVELYMKYGGLSKSEAKDNVYCHVFDQTYPKLAGLSKAAKLKYRDASKTNVPADVFAKAYQVCNAMESDNDASGKSISGSKKQKIVNYIMSLSGLSNSQRKAIWDAVKGTTSDKGTPWE